MSTARLRVEDWSILKVEKFRFAADMIKKGFLPGGCNQFQNFIKWSLSLLGMRYWRELMYILICNKNEFQVLICSYSRLDICFRFCIFPFQAFYFKNTKKHKTSKDTKTQEKPTNSEEISSAVAYLLSAVEQGFLHCS